MAGTIDFRHDAVNDLVVSRPRWTLTTAVDVMRWYQMHAGYFGGRFKSKKDLIVLHEAFDVAPKVASLWGQYRARLHESYLRFSVRVNSNPRVRLTTNTSAARYSISAVECASLDEAVASIHAARVALGTMPPGSGSRPSASFRSRPSMTPPKLTGDGEPG